MKDTQHTEIPDTPADRLAYVATILGIEAPKHLRADLLANDGAPHDAVMKFCRETGASLDFIYQGDIRPLLHAARPVCFPQELHDGSYDVLNGAAALRYLVSEFAGMPSDGPLSPVARDHAIFVLRAVADKAEAIAADWVDLIELRGRKAAA